MYPCISLKPPVYVNEFMRVVIQQKGGGKGRDREGDREGRVEVEQKVVKLEDGGCNKNLDACT